MALNFVPAGEPAKVRSVYTRPATEAKLKIEKVPGVRAVAIQSYAGYRHLYISAVHTHGKRSGTVEIGERGTVGDGAVRYALRELIGRDAANAYGRA